MIVLIEPLCKGHSHEKFNSGFLTGISQAFPDEEIVLFADQTHNEALRKILKLDGIELSRISYVNTHIPKNSTFLGFIYSFLFYAKIFSKALGKDSSSRFLFLSYDKYILKVLSFLNNKIFNKKLKTSMVLHGSFENIAPMPKKKNPQSLAVFTIPHKQRANLKGMGILKAIAKILNRIKLEIMTLVKYPFFSFLISRLIDEKQLIEKGAEASFRFLYLSPHILVNLKKIVKETSQFFYVPLPTNFKKDSSIKHNNSLKLAIFGYGNSLVLHNILLKLQSKNIKNNYEITIIGMDDRGIEGFSNVHCVSPGIPLTREEMEEHAKDQDIFLILYDENSYRLSCSGAIFEALSNSKPIVHFKNECIDFYNSKELPIGISCNDLDTYVNELVFLIENPETAQSQLSVFRKNINLVREKYSISNNTKSFREFLTWP